MIRKKGEPLVDVANIALEDKDLEAEFVVAEECGVIRGQKIIKSGSHGRMSVAHMGTPEH